MSSKCETFVEEHSPYSRDTYTIHLRLAVIANEAHDYRIFMSEKRMCELCRCSPKTLQRAKKRLIEDGFLELVFPAQGRQIAEYRFLMPGIAGHGGGAGQRIAGHGVPNSQSSGESSPINRNKYKRSETGVSQPPLVDISEYARTHSEGSDAGPERARRLREIALGGILDNVTRAQ